MAFNEDSRVKIPALLHLTRLGYQYIPQNQQNKIEETNIFTDIFFENIQRINPNTTKDEIKIVLDEIILEADFEDFHFKVDIYFKRLFLNSKQSQELAQLRDWLLPMLMDGQVRVG